MFTKDKNGNTIVGKYLNYIVLKTKTINFRRDICRP